MTGVRHVPPPVRTTDTPARPTADRPAGDELARRAIGWELVRLRTRAGFTQEQLAARCELSVPTIRRWEGGAPTLINLPQLRAIAAALGVTAGALIDAGATGARTNFPRPGPGSVSGPDSDPGPPSSTGNRPDMARGVRSAFVLLPTRLPGNRHAATAWRLLHYLPYEPGQRWERADDTDPGRTISRPILDWASEVLRCRAELFGSASELTGQRSWYVGPVHNPTTGGTGESP